MANISNAPHAGIQRGIGGPDHPGKSQVSIEISIWTPPTLEKLGHPWKMLDPSETLGKYIVSSEVKPLMNRRTPSVNYKIS